MTFLAELLAELFGWFGLGQAGKDFEKGNRKRAMVLLILFLMLLAGIFVYIIYGIIDSLIHIKNDRHNTRIEATGNSLCGFFKGAFPGTSFWSLCEE